MRNIAALIFLLSTGCAAPAPEFERQQFVPKIEIVVNSLYQEGVRLYRAGRFIDAELKLRQAIYLFPTADNITANLALVLKNSGMLDEAVSIYRSLIEKYPKVYDYKFSLADAALRKGENEKAYRLFREAMLGFEAAGDTVNAAQTARHLATLYFIAGDEENALCYSAIAMTYLPTAEQQFRHIKLLNSAGYTEKAVAAIKPFLTDLSAVKDPSLLKLAAITFYPSDVEDSKKFLQLAVDYQSSASTIDAELETLRRVYAFKFPEPAAEEELETEEEEEEAVIVFNEQAVLYWPVELEVAYREYQQQFEIETENE